MCIKRATFCIGRFAKWKEVSNMRKYSVFAFSLLATVLLLVGSSARANDFTFTAGNSALIVDIGNNYGPYGGVYYDTLQLTGLSGSTGPLSLGQTVDVPISTVDFAAGPNCYGTGSDCPNSQGNVPFTMTVGTTQTLSPSYNDVIGDSFDTLTISGSSPVWFPVAGGYIEVTSLPYGPVDNYGGDDTGTLWGSFTYTSTTPEPVSMLLFGTFLSLAGGWLGRKKRAV
jgi:hypothetical protein